LPPAAIHAEFLSEVEVMSELVISARLSQPKRRSAIGRLLLVLLSVGIFAVGFSCDAGETTWSSEARSPDGLWLATATSRSEGGGPTAYDFTIVTLKFLKRSDAPTEILGFTQQSPTMNLRMEWVTPKHLHVTYGPRGASDHVSLDFQVVKMSGIEISVRDLSVKTKSP
jgi:hypothetical protein